MRVCRPRIPFRDGHILVVVAHLMPQCRYIPYKWLFIGLLGINAKVVGRPYPQCVLYLRGAQTILRQFVHIVQQDQIPLGQC